MNEIRKRTAIVAALTACATLWGGCSDSSTPTAGSQSYNVLLITTDTTRADRLGSYGYEKPTSPHLDALAADAARFEFAMSTAGLTPIAHASIFSGLNPYSHGVRVMYGSPGHYLSKNIPTMATLLKQKGYATGGFVSAYPASERYGTRKNRTLSRGG